VLEATARRLDQLADSGAGSLLEDYRRDSLVVGRRVKIYAEHAGAGADRATLPRPLAEGKVLAVGPDLALTMEGYDRPVSRGRLAFVTDHPRP
jgi:hypothetical protein